MTRPHHKARRVRAGTTALELIVSTGILVLILGFAGMVGNGGRDVYLDASVKTSREQQARRVLERIVTELAVAGRDTLFPVIDPLFGAEEIHFQQSDGVVDGALAWGPLTRIRLVYEDGEIDDGIDQDGDGLVDECRLVLTRNVGEDNEQETTLCRGVSEYLEGETANAEDDNDNGLVDERGFSLSLEGDVLGMRLTLATARSEGPVVLRTLETSLKLRN